MKILIAYDGSESADSALDDLARAGLPTKGVQAQVVTVAEVWLPPMEDGKPVDRSFVTPALKRKYEESLELLDEAGKKATEAAERVGRLFPEWRIEPKSTYGSPAWELLGMAEQLEADLIVVGAKGCSAYERVLLGSVSQKIAAEAQCPVRVSRGRVIVDESPVRLLVGYDGSEGSREAVRTISGREWPTGTEVRILIVEDSIFVRSSLEISVDQIKEVGTELADDLSKAGISASLVIAEGNPKDELVSQAEKWDADCIFIGATRYNDIFTRYLIGSVSSAVVTRAECSVEVVRPLAYKMKSDEGS